MTETELGKAGGVVRTIVETVSDEITRINQEIDRLDKVVRVVDRAGRDAIPAADRYEGLWVEVLGEAKVYRLTDGLTNDHWQERVGVSAVGVPVADADQYGVVKIGSGITISDGTISVPTPIVFIKGMILPFSGTFSGIYPIDPATKKGNTAWQLCDGTNGTPNLYDRFIIGAGKTYAAKATGGVLTHTHTLSGNVGATTLTVAQMPKHSHNIGPNYNTNASGAALRLSGNATRDSSVLTAAVGGGGSHTHSLTSGASTAASNLPPYFALAYIMYMGG